MNNGCLLYTSGKTVDTETGEIVEEESAKENDGVVDFRQAKQAQKESRGRIL